MRETASRGNRLFEIEELASIANMEATKDISSYGDMGVGAALGVAIGNDDPTIGARFAAYSASNINISGMQVKTHAEQLALKQLLLDYEELDDSVNVVISDMVVVTDSECMDLVCGHCLQITRSVCDYIDCDPSGVSYVAGEKLGTGKYELGTERYEFDKYSLNELLSETYAE